MIKQIAIVLLVGLVGCSEHQTTDHITHRSDYASYLSEKDNIEVKKASLETGASFWETKIEEQPGGYIYFQKLAAMKAQAFEVTGDVTLLTTSDSLFKMVNTMVADHKKASNYISLSSNAVTQHQFKNAMDYAHKAMEHSKEKYGPSLMVFDAAMELGLYDVAERMIVATKNLESFDYLVRLSKFQDYKGNLDSAIVLMETAFEQVKNKKNTTSQWAEANLADMYGHAGRLEESYSAYLEVLNKNPNYQHALKGIAWIAYSKEKNTDAAWEIYNHLVDKKPLPDYHLLLAELAEYTNDMAKKEFHNTLFLKEATKDKYKGMYNKYLITLYAEEYGEYNKALLLANEEIENRATPMTYSLLAWVYDQKGHHVKALEIIKDHVEDKSFEPELIYKTGVIYASNNLYAQANKYLKEAKEASFELGPLTTRKVDQLLESL